MPRQSGIGMLMDAAQRRLAVLGSPISHSQSPALHGAAYRALGLDWEYERQEITEQTLQEFIDSRGPEWRGFSITMPLKQAVIPLFDERDPLVDLTGAANTLLFDRGRRRGWNTDVFGITEPLRNAGLTHIDRALVLGGGATAACAIAAVHRLGADRVTVAVRTPARADWLRPLAEAQRVELEVRSLAELDDVQSDVVVSTIPNGSTVDLQLHERLTHEATLFEVAYKPWPTSIAAVWLAAGGRVLHGLEMLAYQALVQVRIFVQGDAEAPLPDEPAVFAKMREAVGLEQ
ncbi:shikimate dehydrogenase [Ruicaihuangia caeni]|uniref:Shikimate dehydrogenase n=1 Tax=Ruicaihuangia caeni TaxID=3042517 RepID=A0AAW6T2R4_9MICO|nr:shikimate dehydrogenase [Klugiella sp. YN-L-19]MDI2098062.1 shikimate dehydrogenase [Klugiella sp. YN-L-19]